MRRTHALNGQEPPKIAPDSGDSISGAGIQRLFFSEEKGLSIFSNWPGRSTSFIDRDLMLSGRTTFRASRCQSAYMYAASG